MSEAGMRRIAALVFDQDGVIIDTERDGHRVAFNRTFKEFGFSCEWGVEEYHGLLQIAGGKERMRHYLHTKGFGVDVDPADEGDLIKRLHERKTRLFIEMLKGGDLPLRPGIRRIMREAAALGLRLGICTTSDEKAARVVAGTLLHDINFDLLLAGDVVQKKKPDPEIYLLALERMRLDPGECIVFEDSQNGVRAAAAAGMNIVATTNGYTENEDLGGADIVVTCLGDPGGEMGKLIRARGKLELDGVVGLAALLEYFRTALDEGGHAEDPLMHLFRDREAALRVAGIASRQRPIFRVNREAFGEKLQPVGERVAPVAHVHSLRSQGLQEPTHRQPIQLLWPVEHVHPAVEPRGLGLGQGLEGTDALQASDAVPDLLPVAPAHVVAVVQAAEEDQARPESPWVGSELQAEVGRGHLLEPGIRELRLHAIPVQVAEQEDALVEGARLRDDDASLPARNGLAGRGPSLH
jgi:HAD superfamily hydrolase (TIGR01509 family)